MKRAGAKGHFFEPGKGVVSNGSLWEPDFNDPVFLAKLDRFLAAAAARYDGSPEVAFVDVGSFGVWGEGHTFWSTKLPYNAATIRKHIDLYRKNFKRTLLAANDDFASHGRGQQIIEYARLRGLTLRDDSIMAQCGAEAFKSDAAAQAFWPKLPVILESEHYGPSMKRGCWGDGSAYLDAVEKYHASYASIHWWPREFLESNRRLIDTMNRRIGYRLQIAEASWPAAVKAGEEVALRYSIRNAGVAPCYPGGHVAFTVKDADGGIAAVFADEGFDVRALTVAAPGKAEVTARDPRFRVPRLKPGYYQLFASVGSATGTPKIAMALADDDGQRRYFIGQFRVQ